MSNVMYYMYEGFNHMQKRIVYTTNRLMQARASSTRKRSNGSGEF